MIGELKPFVYILSASIAMGNGSTDSLNKKRQDDKSIKLLSKLTATADNDSCADCNSKAPKWASTSQGVFLCIRCAGIHRKMGSHISKIKSINLDSWTDDEIKFMKENGNSKVNKRLLGPEAPAVIPLNDDFALETYIINKYEKRSYEAIKQNSDKEFAKDHADQITALVNMGFKDKALVILSLRKSFGKLDAALELLLSNTLESSTLAPQTSAKKLLENASVANEQFILEKPTKSERNLSNSNKNLSISDRNLASHINQDSGAQKSNSKLNDETTIKKAIEKAMNQLKDMGFINSEDNLNALKSSKGNITEAITYLANAKRNKSEIPKPMNPVQKDIPVQQLASLNTFSKSEIPASLPQMMNFTNQDPFSIHSKIDAPVMQPMLTIQTKKIETPIMQPTIINNPKTLQPVKKTQEDQLYDFFGNLPAENQPQESFRILKPASLLENVPAAVQSVPKSSGKDNIMSLYSTGKNTTNQLYPTGSNTSYTLESNTGYSSGGNPFFQGVPQQISGISTYSGSSTITNASNMNQFSTIPKTNPMNQHNIGTGLNQSYGGNNPFSQNIQGAEERNSHRITSALFTGNSKSDIFNPTTTTEPTKEKTHLFSDIGPLFK